VRDLRVTHFKFSITPWQLQQAFIADHERRWHKIQALNPGFFGDFTANLESGIRLYTDKTDHSDLQAPHTKASQNFKFLTTLAISG
jgi:hypothetical protein